MDSLGFYDTRGLISKLLVEQFQTATPQKILDLGCGQGSLLKAALGRWPQSLVHAAEIDRQRHERIQSSFPNIRAIHIDGLDKQLELHLEIDEGTIDVAVCNPPYRRFPATPDFQSLLKAAGLDCKYRVLTADLLFLAQNIRLLKPLGELGIILPDGLLTNKDFISLRQVLIDRHEVFGVIQLPDKAFSHTEARAHILLLRRNGVTASLVPLHKANLNGEIISTVSVPKSEIVHRMDHDYWHWRSTMDATKGITLAQLEADIRRGQRTRRELENQRLHYVHTSDLPATPGKLLRLPASIPNSVSGLVATPGDILLARVGKRCIGRVALVESGYGLLTDCVYRIRVPEAWRSIVWRAFGSQAGQDWLRAQAHGVCAQVISKGDLRTFAVFDEVENTH